MKSDNSASGEVERLVDRVKAGPGGAMTDEVGVITGDLTVATSLQPDGRAGVAVQYTDADEWYTLTGSPAPLPHPDGLRQLHDTVLKAIKAGGGAEVPT
ncbi:hypothetical protein ACFY83_34735 [Streptomyces althioticus]|uniref:Uncharacterized protein n=1 Tax=Streptomyces griseorubens TaxID=66897 RepID=A0ABR4TAC3_9ACTN|nr:hypothetical protein [Streptomyces griseorubens]KEG44392.1 hypothetical protein DJ64_00230 [Streptomyces griseorubens]MCC9690168.1 hypothetical protein [Streptomyces sp. MNU103]